MNIASRWNITGLTIHPLSSVLLFLLGKSVLALRYLSLVVIESGVQNFIAKFCFVFATFYAYRFFLVNMLFLQELTFICNAGICKKFSGKFPKVQKLNLPRCKSVGRVINTQSHLPHVIASLFDQCQGLRIYKYQTPTTEKTSFGSEGKQIGIYRWCCKLCQTEREIDVQKPL